MICREPTALLITTAIALVYVVDYFWPKPELCYVELNKSPFIAKWVECDDQYQSINMDTTLIKTTQQAI
jgi:hypothetical protein